MPALKVKILLIAGCFAIQTIPAMASANLAGEMANQRKLLEQARQSTIPWLPADADERREPEQHVLRSRGLYLDQVGIVRRLESPDKLGCNGLKLEAHRGHPLYPENGIYAIRGGFSARYNSVEVDAQQLKDGTWVFHHDKVTERTLVHPFGNQAVKKLSRPDWINGVMRGRDGLNTTEPISDALTSMILSGAYRQPNQTLNIEIKNYRSCAALHTLDTMAKLTLGHDGVAYSSLNDIKPLTCLRELNPTSYLAIVQGPNRKALETWAKTKHGRELASLKGNRLLRAGAKFAQNEFGAYKFQGLNSTKELRHFRAVLGENSGIHVEIQDLIDDPGIMRRARAAGMLVKSYTINSNEAHLAGLRKLKAKGALPDGAIVDSTPIRTCKVLGLES